MIYLDNASTTPICEAAKKIIIEHLDDFGNPSSSHEFGHKATILIEEAREKIAQCINAAPEEIYFTSGGSEANTWALYNRGTIISEIEHHSILKRANPPWKTAFTMPVTSEGICKPESVSRFLEIYNERFSTNVASNYVDTVSCMLVNNELGTIQPIRPMCTIAHHQYRRFHTDAVQAVGHIHINVKDLNCDMLSASGHKFGGIKGSGFLYVKNGIEISPLIYGGKQEFGKRGGTENVIGIIAMAAALEDSVKNMEERNQHIKYLRDKLMHKLLQIDGSHINGSLEHRVDSNVNIRFDGISGASLVTLCSLHGIYISSGSACNEGISEPSHVLTAIGLSKEEALSSIRITIGYENTEEEIDKAGEIITKLIERIRGE